LKQIVPLGALLFVVSRPSPILVLALERPPNQQPIDLLLDSKEFAF